MTRDETNKDAALPTVKVSGAAFFVFVVLALAWFIGIGVLQDLLQVDATCSGEEVFGRRARIAEAVTCLAAEGPSGWMVLGWSASLPLFIILWLKRALHKAKTQRG